MRLRTSIIWGYLEAFPSVFKSLLYLKMKSDVSNRKKDHYSCEKNLLLFYKRGHKRNLFGSCGSGFKKDDLRKDFPEKIFLYKQKISRLVTNGVSKY